MVSPSSQANSTTVASHAGGRSGHGDCCSGTGRGVHLYEIEARKSILGGLLAHLAISSRETAFSAKNYADGQEG
jgi:hypothetical protein